MAQPRARSHRSGGVALLVAAMMWLLAPGPAGASEKAPLTLGFMPYLNAQDLLARYTPLADYLSKALDRPVQVTLARDYAEHLRRTGKDELDISFLGGSSYVVVGNAYGNKPLLVRYEFKGKPTFHAAVFVAAESNIETLEDLKGRRMAFGSVESTLSTQVPVSMLMEAGVDLSDLAAYSHLRNHQNVLMGVAYGDFDAGAVAAEVFHEHQTPGVRLLAESPPLSTHVLVTRRDLDPETRAALREALLALKDHPEGPAILQAIAPSLTGFVPAEDHHYERHRRILEQVLPILHPGQ